MLRSQSLMTPSKTDSISYSLYLQGDHASHEQLTHEALEQHIDFYYLRIRAGLLDYGAKKYFLARKHLERALFYYPADTMAQEYLFYTYLYLGRNQDAEELYTKFSPEMRRKLEAYRPLNNAAYIEAGYFTSNAASVVPVNEIHGKPPVIYSEADHSKNIQYYQLGLNTNYTKKTSLYFGFTYLNLSKEKVAYWGPRDTASDYHYHQFEYYLGLNHNMKNDWQFQAAFHYLDYKSTVMYSKNDTAAKTFKFYNTDVKQNNVVLNAGLSKEIRGFLKPALDLSYSSLNKTNILQLSGRITYYLTGNKHLYGMTGYAMGFDTSGSRWVFMQKIGGRLAPKLWLECYGYFGNLTNFNDANAFLVYNVSDKITGKYGASLSILATHHLDISMRYDFIMREGSYEQISKPNSIRTVNYNYNNQAVIGSIRWKF
ncbi:MAG: hypothetical protein JST26_10635 [Bacteroidetes bacterium]|nr:hypothetical protein [Bacteroidota bacterium]